MTNKHTLTVLIISIIFALGSAAGLGWLLLENAKLGGDMRERVDVIANAIAQEQQYAELENLIDSSEPMRTSLNELVLTEGSTIDFLAQIEQAGDDQGVTLETVSLNVEETEDIFDELIVDFLVVGQADRVAKMMRVLETIPLHSQLQSVAVANDRELGVATMNVTLSVSLISS